MADLPDRLLAAARRRLERTGGALEGSIGLNAPTDDERRAIIGITGIYRPEGVKRLTVSLADLDAVIPGGLIRALGGQVRDRAAERAAEEAAREELLATPSEHAGTPWFAGWLAAMSADGTLTRLIRRGDGHLIRQACAVLDLLPASFVPLPVLAEAATGDTKALGRGSPLATLVLRALAMRTSGEPKHRSSRREGDEGADEKRSGRDHGHAPRELWESAGVIVDDLASQVLVLNVRTGGGSVVSRWLDDAAAHGIPFRLTLQQQVEYEIVPDAEEIFVCENPAVLRAAAAELGTASAALVCTEGIPSAACHKLLTGYPRLRWRADFDWTGLRILASAQLLHGAIPWRMGVADYSAGLELGESTPLTGTPSASLWDEALADAMATAGRAVMEERLIPALLADLTRTG
ncbi:TIGR02679 family protein [Nonomuraea sp. MG754425]|uniref:TIGR02679 family protein n=1 Tax=Nonomuraea sp. MG754425 TaxID=2570319 RepID=UPI001F19F90F|nr:TIGR02679 family protein [Nonomuraea sp. MG754425]MCF6475298.1 TIGR02679 family protein [Nonomuraea sp. MG754425]